MEFQRVHNRLFSQKTVQPEPNNQLILGHMSYLSLLGFQEGKAAESSQYDLVFLHVGAAELEPLVGVVSQIEGSKESHFAAGQSEYKCWSFKFMPSRRASSAHCTI
ncbi:unnamed protein product [Malus baccata var. baccata]